MIYKNEDITKAKINKINPIKEILKLFVFAIIIIAVYTLSLILMSLKSEEQTYIFGLKAYIITTTSMEPEFTTGDLIVIRKCNYNELRKGNIITFTNRGETITHRIVSIDDKTGKITTKGDKNSLEDIEPINSEVIEGIYVFKIPKFAFVEYHIKNGSYWALILLIILTLVLHIKRLNRKKSLRRRKKKIEDKKNQSFN